MARPPTRAYEKARVMATKIELIIKITDDEQGEAQASFALFGDDYETTKEDFKDHMFYRGGDFVERSMENPKFEQAKVTKKNAKGKPGGGGKTADKPRSSEDS